MASLNPQILILLAASGIMLSGCVDRAQADAKLAKGCEAGVNSLLKAEDRTISKVKDTKFTPSPEGQGFRHVTLVAMEGDDWLETEMKFECVFEESFGFLQTSYTASIFQVRLGDDRVVGRVGGDIMGSTNDFLNLTEAIRKAMYE